MFDRDDVKRLQSLRDIDSQIAEKKKMKSDCVHDILVKHLGAQVAETILEEISSSSKKLTEEINSLKTDRETEEISLSEELIEKYDVQENQEMSGEFPGIGTITVSNKVETHVNDDIIHNNDIINMLVERHELGALQVNPEGYEEASRFQEDVGDNPFPGITKVSKVSTTFKTKKRK